MRGPISGYPSRVAGADITPCKLCGYPLGHTEEVCHSATTGADELIRAGVRKAGSQANLARILGVSIAGLSRARGRADARAKRPKALPRDLNAQTRFDLVQYLLDRPIYAPPKVPGRPERLDVESVSIHLPAPVQRRFQRAADEHARGFLGVVVEAMEAFTKRHKGKPRSALPMHGTLVAPAASTLRVRVDSDALRAFDLVIGGPGWRRFYLPIAIERWLHEHHRTKAAGA